VAKGGSATMRRGEKTCYNCGASDHAARDCAAAWTNYAHAKCFVCGETGHLSKSCPRNERGVYVNGGECKICKAKDHLVKDCPHKGDTCIRCGERGHFAAGCSKPFAGAKTTKAKTGEKRRLGGDDLDDDFVAGGRDDGDGVDGDASEDAGVEAEEVEAESKKNPSKKSKKDKKNREVVFS